MTTRIGYLTGYQVLMLKRMLKAYPEPLTIEELTEIYGMRPGSQMLGPRNTELVGNYRDSLRFKRLVDVIVEEQDDGSNLVLWKLTQKGLEAAKTFKARKRTTNSIPGTIIDPIVRKLHQNHTYGFELYTHEDLQEILNSLPEEYENMDLEHLRQQVVNRRKQGAFARNRIEWPVWYIEYRQTTHFEQLRETLLEYYIYSCSISENHRDDVDVYHRRLANDDGNSVFNNEKRKDCALLCPTCFKRNARFMVRIPERNPIGK